MIINLENNYLKVNVNSHGAELVSVIKKNTGKEYIWQANPAHWNRHAPILFPNVGKYKDGHFFYKGVEYKQSQHGFARNMEFTLIEKTNNSCLFELLYTEETLKVYPFKFKLRLGYILEDSDLTLTYYVENLDNEKMYFQIGGHPAFNVPLVGGIRSDYYFYFPKKKEIISSKVGDLGLATDEKLVYKLDGGYLRIEDDLFKNDALVIENQDINEVIICDKNHENLLSVRMNVDVFGLWSASDKAPFVCVEPWYGRCDAENFSGEINNRKYENELNSKKVFERGYKLHIY